MKHGWSIPVVVALWLIAEGVALTQAPGAGTQNAGAGRVQTPAIKNPLEGKGMPFAMAERCSEAGVQDVTDRTRAETEART